MKRVRGVLAAAALAGLALAFSPLGPESGRPIAYAEVPVGEPVFTEPLEITNPFFPVIPGTVKVYIGRDEGLVVTIVESHLAATREFEWNGQTVTCRILQELKFVDGVMQGRDSAYYAQADDGTVFFFGETEDPDVDDDDDEEEPSGWVVGQRIESDPVDVLTGASPQIIMPAAPSVGDVWDPENVPPAFLKTLEMVQAGDRVKVPAGRYLDCIRIREKTPLRRAVRTEWYTPGVGLVKVRGRATRLRLQASVLQADAPR